MFIIYGHRPVHLLLSVLLACNGIPLFPLESPNDRPMRTASHGAPMSRASPLPMSTRQVSGASPLRMSTRQVSGASPLRMSTRQVSGASPLRMSTRQVSGASPLRMSTRQVSGVSPLRMSTRKVSGASSPRITSRASDAFFPNPRFEPRACHRVKPSFLCDPDGILSADDADKLDFLTNQVHTSTSCVCANCPLGGSAGVSVGIFLKKNFTLLQNSEFSAQRLAARLRHQWQLGPCGDDIILVLLTEAKQSAMEVGPAVLHVVPQDVAEKIFHDSSVHFENGFYSQGLESMVNSFRDILRRFQKQRVVSASTKRTGLIIGLSLGIVVLIILLVTAAVILTRQRRNNKSQSRNQGRGMSGWHKNRSSSDSAAFGYALCRAEDKDVKNRNSGSSDSDEDSETEHPGKYNGHLEIPNSRLRDPLPRRQLSYVAEETEEEEDDVTAPQAAVLGASTNRVRSTEVTEL